MGGRPRLKRFRDDLEDHQTGFSTLITHTSTQDGTRELREIFQEKVFDFPKPSALIETLVKQAGSENALILDSFAGSGTTAHAVLAANQKDGGNRRFILVETEDYADTLTAERVRRVIRGVPGAKDAALKAGLSGDFTYCELGEPIDLQAFFDGKSAPSYEQVARYVTYTATGHSPEAVPGEMADDGFVAEAGGYRVHLIYRPDRDFMRGNDAALSKEMAARIANAANGKPVLVFAAAKFLSQSELTRMGVTFCQLPWSVHRVLGDAPDAT